MDKKETLNLRVQKRINSDLQELGKNIEELNENGIYWHVEEDNIRDVFVVITGQEGTPYANAPFFFKFHYTDNYPLVPPEAKFCTSDGQTRFNPNLYIEGKICLSILGTWSGPSWTPVMTLKTVIMSIIALVMTGEPVKNEPGWENAAKQDIDDYNNVVEFRSLSHAIISQLTNCQECFRPMYDKMVDKFKKDFPKIIERIDANATRLKGIESIKPRYGSLSKIDYVTLKKDMLELGRRFGIETITEEPAVAVESQIEINPTKTPASNFELGLEVNFKGKLYKVSSFKNGKKYWKKN